MSEDLTGEGVYETVEDLPGTIGAQRITRRVGTVRAVSHVTNAGFVLLVADEHGNLVTRAASDVHLKRPPRAL
jgi:hypothetical protein